MSLPAFRIDATITSIDEMSHTTSMEALEAHLTF